MIHNIIHLSDIHIRAGNKDKSRYEEYLETFKRTFTSIRSQSCIQHNNAVIVVTGDLFHHKNKLEPYGLELALFLMNGLASLAHVFVIRGNHDYRQDVPKEQDMISAIMSYNIPNVTYLNTTGIHNYENISFGLVAIQDTLLYGSTTGIAGKLPDFPIPVNNSNYKVALFHGSITHSTLQNGMSFNMSGYPIDWFQGYDTILLGDIHLQQIKRAEIIEYKSDSIPFTTYQQSYQYDTQVPWGYPGSLIQQDFGESLLGHGYAIWNLKDKLIHTVHVHNPYGFIKSRYVNAQLDVCINNLYIPIEQCIQNDWFPTNVKLFISGKQINTDVLLMITKMFQSNNKNVLFIKQASDISVVSQSLPETTQIVNINSTDILIEYIQSQLSKQNIKVSDVWKNWLKHPEQILISTDNFPEKILPKIIDKSEKIQKGALKYLNDFEKVISQKNISGILHINRLEWNWILNYKDSNIIDYDKNSKKIYVVNGKNGNGKSNYLEIQCIALYGEGFPSRENNNYSAGIICDKKPIGVMANTTIVFTINNITYKLLRVMRPNRDSRSINYEKIVLSILGETEMILHQQKGAVHPWIDSHIGSIDTYLMSAMLSQNADLDFFSLNKNTQKTLLDKILSLNHIISLQSLLKDSTKYYKNVIELLETYCDGSTECIDPSVAQELDVVKLQLLQCSEKRIGLQSKWNSISEQQLLNVNFDDMTQIHQNLLQKISTNVETMSAIDMKLRLDNINVMIEHMTSEFNYYYTFSDLKEMNLKKFVYDETTFKDLQSSLKLLRTYLENHPLYTSYNMYQDIDVLSSVITMTFANNDNELLQTIKEYNMWNKMKLSEFSDIVLNNSSTFTELSDKLLLCDKTILESPGIIKHCKIQFDKLKKQCAKKKDEYDSMIHPNKTNKTVQWFQNIEQQFSSKIGLEDGLTLKSKYNNAIYNIPRLCISLQSTQREILDIESYIKDCKNVPFNSECSACQQQTWRKKYQTMMKRLPELQKIEQTFILELEELSCLDIELDIELYDEYCAELQIKYTELTNWIETLHEYNIHKQMYDEYSLWFDKYSLIKTEYELLQKNVNDHTISLKDYESKYEYAMLEKRNIQTQIDVLSKKKTEYDSYLIENEHKLIIFNTCQSQLQQNGYNKLFEYRQKIEQYIGMIKSKLNNLKLNRKQFTLRHQRVIEHDKLVIQEHDLYTILNTYPHYIQWTLEMNCEKDLDLKVRELETIITGKRIGVYNKLSDVIIYLQQNMEILSYLSDAFGGYREWLYKEQIAPMIQSRVNHVLQMICDDRPLFLEAEWLDKIDTLSWFIRDGNSRPIIEKASGFQRFIVGIAVRVAFHQIGLSQIQYDQLFIDEGFTSCDSDNLEKVPDFLRGLLQFYDSICLVTHLEDLKPYADIHIHIQRSENGLSQIRYGESITDLVDNSTKKKGRPIKVTKV